MRFLPILFALIFTACATSPPNREPFQAFLDATSQVAESAEQAITHEYEQSLEAYENRFKTGEQKDVVALMLSFDETEVFEANYKNDPVFIAIGEQRRQLGELNQLVTQYAALLVRIVGASGAYNVDEQAAALNEQTQALIASVNELGSKETARSSSHTDKVDKSAWLSTAFAATAKAYIESKRRASLVELLHLGQPLIDAYAQLGQAIALTGAASLKTDYSNRFLGAVKRDKKHVKGLLAINKAFVGRLKTLKELDGAFQALPKEHVRLTAAVAAGAEVSFSALVERAESLKSLYEGISEVKAEPEAEKYRREEQRWQ